jgi:hypothetical protein
MFIETADEMPARSARRAMSYWMRLAITDRHHPPGGGRTLFGLVSINITLLAEGGPCSSLASRNIAPLCGGECSNARHLRDRNWCPALLIRFTTQPSGVWAHGSFGSWTVTITLKGI